MLVWSKDRELADELREHYRQLRTCYVVEYRRFVNRYQGYDPADYGRRSMPVWDGGTDDSGKTHQAVWPRLAHFALSNRVSPFELTRAVFHGWGNHQSPPTPRQLMSEKSLALVGIFRANKARAIEVSVIAARSALAAELSAALRSAPPERSRAQVAVSVIMDRSQAPVLVKYCAAIACGVAELAWQLRHQAALEYLAYPEEWARALGEYLPEDFTEYARDYVLPSLIATD